MAAIDLTSGVAGAYGAGELQLENKVQMTSTLTPVTDNLNVASPLLLSTDSVTSRGLASEVGSTAYGTTALRSTTTGIDNTAIGYNGFER
jgi:hypothetical protein